MRNKRVIGEELLRFVDGEELTVEIHAVGNYYINQERKRFRKTSFNKKGKIENVDFNDGDFYLNIAKLSIGSAISIEDLREVDNIKWEDFFKKYFELTDEKKAKLLDIPDLNQDKKSQE